MLDNVLTILDEHYNNVKALDALNQELFQMRMANKEMVSDWGVHLSRHLQILAASFPDHFPPDHIAKLKRDCFYGRLPVIIMFHWQQQGPHERGLCQESGYLCSICENRLRSTLREAQAQSTTEAHQQKWYYDRKIGAVNLKPGNLVLVKADAWKGKRKIKNR